MAHIHVIMKVEHIDGAINDCTILSKAFTHYKKALQEVQEDAIEMWDMFVDPNSEDAEKFPGLDIETEDGRITIKDTDLNADHTEWFIIKREIV